MPALGRRVRDSLSYANATATLALFIALGGASYAAVVLPPDSVGPAQIKPGAVRLHNLSFPLGTASVADDSTEELSNGACNGPLFPGQAPPPCIPPQRTYVPAPHQLHISLHSAGHLSITAVIGLNDHGTSQATANVTVRVIIDDRVASESETEMTGGQLLQVPAQALVPATAGTHTVGISIEADYSARPENVLVAPVSIIATILPPAA